MKIDFEDIREDVEFWKNLLVVYVRGCNLFLNVMEGFFQENMGEMWD